MGAYNVVDTTLVDKITEQLVKVKKLDEGTLTKFRVDMIYFLNYVESQLHKEINNIDETDFLKYQEHLRDDYTFLDLADRRMSNARKGLEFLQQIKTKK